jgi:hypothetical protein
MILSLRSIKLPKVAKILKYRNLVVVLYQSFDSCHGGDPLGWSDFPRGPSIVLTLEDILYIFKVADIMPYLMNTSGIGCDL